MVSESGPTGFDIAPVPERFDLTDASREIVMDRHDGRYTLAAEEMRREGKIDEGGYRRVGPHSGRAPLRVRRSVHGAVERRRDVLGARDGRRARALVRLRPRPAGISASFEPAASGAHVPLPPGAGRPDAIRFRASALPRTSGSAPADTASVRLVRVNKVFTVDADYRPLPSVFSWTGSVPLCSDPHGEWHELPFR